MKLAERSFNRTLYLVAATVAIAPTVVARLVSNSQHGLNLGRHQGTEI